MALTDDQEEKMDEFGEQLPGDDAETKAEALNDDDQEALAEEFTTEEASADTPVNTGTEFGERIGNVEDADDWEAAEYMSDEAQDADNDADEEPRASM